MFEVDVPHDKNAPMEEGKYVPLDKEVLQMALGFGESADVMNAIAMAVNGGSQTELETEPVKNVEAPEETD